MSLQFIFGTSGTGKTRSCINEILNSSIDKKIFYITPEPLIVNIQKEIMSILKKEALINVEVLSFEKFIYRIFDEAGLYRKEKADSLTKKLYIIKVIQELRNMKFIDNNIDNVEDIIAIIEELIKNNISVNELEGFIEKIEDTEELLKNKLKDIKAVYNSYSGLLNIPEQNIKIIGERINESNLIKRAYFIIDEFYNFSNFQIELIKQILQVSENTLITLPIDINNKLYANTFKTIDKLKSFCVQNQIEIKKDIIFSENKRHKEYNDLVALENNLLINKINSYDGEVSRIHCEYATNIYDEIEGVATKVFKAVTEEKINYDDIAVLYTNTKAYQDLLLKQFSKKGVPVSYKKKNNIKNYAITNLISSIYEVINNDFAYEDIMKYLRTNFSGLELQEIDYLDNYILRFGIVGYEKWIEDWIYEDLINDDNQDKMEKPYDINEIRKRVITPFMNLKSRFKLEGYATVENYTTYLYLFLEEIDIKYKLEKKYNENFEGEINKEVINIWNLIVNLFEQMNNIIGSVEIKLEYYQSILSKLLSGICIDKSESIADGILFEELSKAALLEKKIVFVLGMNDGYMPQLKNGIGFFNIADIEYLNNNGLEIGSTYEQMLIENQVHFYNQIMKAKEKIYISYAKMDKDDNNLNPAIIISKIKRILKKIKLNKYDGHTNCINNNYLDNKYQLQHETINCLYKDDIYMSATKLQDYAMCPFKYFVKYNLNIKEREIYKLQRLDIGKLYHYVLDKFFKKLTSEKIEIEMISSEYIEDVILKIIDEYIIQNQIFIANARYKFITDMLKSVITKSAVILVNHLKSGKFKPSYFELVFERGGELAPIEIPINNKKKVIISGKIDRVDLIRNSEKTYVKLIDYKSGNKEFNLDDIYNNINIQLVLYLMAILENKYFFGGDIVPAGIFYFKIGDKRIKLEDEKEEDLDEKINKQFQMSGLALSDKEIVNSMDINMAIENSSYIIPVGYKKDGDFTKSSKVATNEEFNELVEQVKKNIAKIGEEILSGDIAAKPYKESNMKACDYCEYKTICCFVPNKYGFKYRKKVKLEK